MSDLIPPNLARSTLGAGLTTGGPSLTVATGEGSKFSSPTGGDVGRLILKRLSDGAVEYATFNARSGDVLTLNARAVEAPGNTALAFSTGDTVVEVWTHQGIINFINAHIGFGVRAYHSTDQNVSTATETALALNSERHDDQAEHDTATNNSRLTAVGSGVRVIVGTATFDTPILAGTVRRVSIRLNGTTVIARQEDFGVLASGQTTVTVSCVYYLASGDYVELLAYQDSGGTIAVKAIGNYSPEFGMLVAGAGSSGSSGHVIQDEGSSLTARSKLNFVGAGVTVTDDSGNDASKVTIPSGPSYVRVIDSKAANTAGGTFTSGAWQTRTLNTKSDDPDSIASLASNQVTLPAGTYRCAADAPAYNVNQHQARLRDITNGVTLLVGSCDQAQSSGGISRIRGLFTLSGTAALEVQHQCGTTFATQGFGPPCNFAEVNIFTEAEFWKVA